MAIEKVEMPKAENPTPELHRGMDTYLGGLDAGWHRGVEAQCQLLAEQGWRKVPSLDDLAKELSWARCHPYVMKVGDPDLFVAKEIHHWLLEGK